MLGKSAYVNQARTWSASQGSALTSEETGKNESPAFREELHAGDIRLCIAEQARQFSRWRRVVLRLLSPELRLVYEVDDVLQEASLNALKSGRSFRGHTKAEFSAWFMGILEHTVQKFARNHRRHTQKNIPCSSLEEDLLTVDGVMEKVSPSPSQEEIFALREEILQFFDSILTLPSDVALLIVFVEVDE